MSGSNVPPNHHVAYGAAMDGIAAARAHFAVIGRYWWNLQMKFLIATRTMGLFKAHWWLFLVAGFLLLAIALPLGIAFILSAICAGELSPKAEDDYIVPLKRGALSTTRGPIGEVTGANVDNSNAGLHRDLMDKAGLHHVCYLRALGRDVDDNEFAAAALGAFDGTVQAHGVKLTDRDMFSMGSAFVVKQFKDLGQRVEIEPEWIAEITSMAMSAEVLNTTRVEAGRMAYAMEQSMRQG